MSAAETVYASEYAPDPQSARDVFGFVMTPSAAFIVGEDPDDATVVADMLNNAKLEAVRRWYDLVQRARRS